MKNICEILGFGLALLLVTTATAFGDARVPEPSGGEAFGDWPQFHLDPEHTGASTSTDSRTNQMAWVSEEIGAVEGASVSVAEGRIYVNCNHQFVCLDQLSGDVLWNATFEPNPYGSWSTPAYNEGRVFFSNWGTSCHDAANGSEIWRFVPPTNLSAVNGGPVVAGGRVIVSDWDGQHYYCLDEKTGDELWNFSVGSAYAQSTPAVSGNRVVLGGWEWNSGIGGEIYCLNLNDGTEIWNISTDNHPCGSAAISDERVYMTTYNFYGDGDLYALSLENGSILWNQTVQRTDSTPVLAGGKVYLSGGCDGFSDLQTYCFDAANGELVWVTDVAERLGDWRCSLAHAGDLVFVGRADYDSFVGTYALNATTGEQVWSYPAGGSSPVVADGMVFTAGRGRVYAFSLANLDIISSDEMGGN
ncbi:PQQ-binding-like beta-propeller repeat protein [Methanothrix sp.]|uniref:outer membrane protein assembly factor BamB family protein n=1 Tax=Methanothrix sp. TaxID=90426 RepID=UPI001BD43FC7